MHQITYEYEGIIYTAEYEVLEDELVIYLPMEARIALCCVD